MQERGHEELLSLLGCRMRGEGVEELQIWDCSSCFRGKKGESGKCPFCTIGVLWSHQQERDVMVSCRDDQSMSFSNIPCFELTFYSPCSISFLGVPHPVSKTLWNGFASRHRSGAVDCSKKVPREELAGSAHLQHYHNS